MNITPAAAAPTRKSTAITATSTYLPRFEGPAGAAFGAAGGGTYATGFGAVLGAAARIGRSGAVTLARTGGAGAVMTSVARPAGLICIVAIAAAPGTA